VSRRSFLSQLAAFPLMAIATRGFATEGAPAQQPSSNPKKSLNIMMKSAWGSDDPTKAAFPFYTEWRSQKRATRYRFIF